MFKRKIKLAANGQGIRPNKGKCPVCRAGEREYCKSTCSLVDGCDPRDR